jgi:hypothetical protein
MAVKWGEVAVADFNQEKGSDVTVRISQTFLQYARIQKQMTKTRRSLLVQAQLAFLLCLIVRPALSQNPVWPQFRGPDSNPVGSHQRLPERWSTTENVEWSVEIPGRGWSSPLVTGHRVLLTTVTTEGQSKPPQIGTEYSNE